MKTRNAMAAAFGILAMGAGLCAAPKAKAWGVNAHASSCYNSASTNLMRPGTNGVGTGNGGISWNYSGNGELVCPVPNATATPAYNAFLADVHGSVATAGTFVTGKACIVKFLGATCGPTRSTSAAGNFRLAFGQAGSGGTGDSGTIWTASAAGSVYNATPYFFVSVPNSSFITNVVICNSNSCT